MTYARSGRPAGRAFGVNTDDNFFPAKPKEDSGASKKPPPPAAPDNGIDKEALMKKLREEMEARHIYVLLVGSITACYVVPSNVLNT